MFCLAFRRTYAIYHLLVQFASRIAHSSKACSIVAPFEGRIIETLSSIAISMGVTETYLRGVVARCEKYYFSYWQAKKSGARRAIDAPNSEMKAIQSWILRNILETFPVHPRACGYVRGKGTRHNAKLHLGRKYILCLDIKDFFPSIGQQKIEAIFKGRLHLSNIATDLASLCAFKGYLPQGGVTSPIISNLAMYEIDLEITALCDGKDVMYSRYADDLTFSCGVFGRLPIVEKAVSVMLRKGSFELNKTKTRYLTGKRRMAVTGINLNSLTKLTISRNRKRLLRSMIFNKLIKNDLQVSTNEIEGWCAYISSIEGVDFERKMMAYIQELKARRNA